MLKKSNNPSKSRMLVSKVAAIVLISGLSVLPIPLEKTIANPCSGISSNGGDGGNGGPCSTNTVVCNFEDVIISEPLGP